MTVELLDRWVRLSGPHKDRPELDEYWLDQMPPVRVEGFGEFFQTEDAEPTLGWTWYEDGTTIALCPLELLIGGASSSAPYRFLDLRAAVGPSHLLFADASSRIIWRAGRDEPWAMGAQLDRPTALDPSLSFMRFRSSPTRRWVVVFVESGFAAFENFGLKMVEQYGELLWEPVDVTETSVTLEHYELGRRQIDFLK